MTAANDPKCNLWLSSEYYHKSINTLQKQECKSIYEYILYPLLYIQSAHKPHFLFVIYLSVKCACLIKWQKTDGMFCCTQLYITKKFKIEK